MWENWKADARKRILAMRRELPADRARGMNEMLAARVLALPRIADARTVYLYASVRGEADTWGLLEHFLSAGIRAALPRVEGREMSFFYVERSEDLEPGAYGIPEPRAGCVRADEVKAVMLVPGVAFSPDGGRLGYGGGFYDRFLAREPEHFTVGLGYGFQILEHMKTEPFDISMDLVVTPEQVYDCHEMRNGRNDIQRNDRNDLQKTV